MKIYFYLLLDIFIFDKSKKTYVKLVLHFKILNLERHFFMNFSLKIICKFLSSLLLNFQEFLLNKSNLLIFIEKKLKLKIPKNSLK